MAERRRRTQLEKAAYLALFQEGYARVTLADVARLAGVSKGTFAYHFGNKEGLMEAVMRRFVRTVVVSTRRAVRLADTPDAKLTAFVEHQFYGLDNTRRFYTVYVDFLAASTKSAPLMGLQRAFVNELLDLDLELAALAGPGVNGERPDTAEVAWQLRALVDGLSVRFLSDESPRLQNYRDTCLRGLRALLHLC